MSDYRTEYESVPTHKQAAASASSSITNLWLQDADGTDSDVDSSDCDSVPESCDVPVLSLYVPESSIAATSTQAAAIHSAMPCRISEVSDEGSAIDDARAAVAAGPLSYKRLQTRPRSNSDPLASDASDSDTTCSRVRRTSMDYVLHHEQRATIATTATSDALSGTKTIEPIPSFLLRSGTSTSVVVSTETPVPPPSQQNGSVVFSTIFSENHRWNWASRFLLGIHEPIRHALFVMDRFLDSHNDNQHATHPLMRSTRTTEPTAAALEKHVRAFFVWFKSYFVEFLHCQHKLKTTVLEPLVQLRQATQREITISYNEIFSVVQQIQALERPLCARPAAATRNGDASAASAMWTQRLDVLQREVRRLYLTLHSVLNLEEKTLHPALSATFSERTFHQYVLPRVFRSIKAKRVVVPWILERSRIWGGDAEQQSIVHMLPFSAKFLYRKFWRPYFVANVVSVMKNLNEFVDPNATVEASDVDTSSHGCAIQ